MRTVNAFMVGALMATLASAAGAQAIQDERAAREECSANSQAGMRECLAKKANTSESTLQLALDRARARLAKWDEDAKYVALAKARLETSSQEFSRYREAHCAFNVSLAGGAIGNAQEIKRLACVAELNARRAHQLEDVVADLTGK